MTKKELEESVQKFKLSLIYLGAEMNLQNKNPYVDGVINCLNLIIDEFNEKFDEQVEPIQNYAEKDSQFKVIEGGGDNE